MTAIILAGGKASRMKGKDKAFLEIGKESLMGMQLKSLKKIFLRQTILNEGGIPSEAGKKIIIVTNSPQRYRNLKGIELVSDIIPDIGPLGGIYSGLSASKSFYNFVVACDMPFIDSGLIKYMYKNACGYDVVVPRINNRYETLFCIYSKNCLKYIKSLLDKNLYKISRFFAYVKVKEISEYEVLRFGLPERLFMNINTPLDLKSLSLFHLVGG